MAPKKRSPNFNTSARSQQQQPRPDEADPTPEQPEQSQQSPSQPKVKRRRQPRNPGPGIPPEQSSSTQENVDPSLSSLPAASANSPQESSDDEIVPESSSRRQSTSSTMRTSSMPAVEGQAFQTPTGRISKAKKGKRVHACSFEGCGKVFTRAEHRRRHELNHNPEAMFPCNRPGCRKAFHRLDLLQRHQERHDLEHQLEAQSAHGRQLNQHGGPADGMGPLPPSTMASPPTSQAGVRTSSAGMSIGSLVHPSTEYRYNQQLGTPSYGGFNRPMPFSNGFISSDDSFYTPDGSQSPASEAYSRYAHRQSISSSSSVAAAFEGAQGSPHVSGSTTWIPSSAPPNVLPANMFEDPSYLNSSTDTSLPIPLTNLDGDEFDIIRRELSYANGIVSAPDGNGIPDAIRWDCLEYYWQNFHPHYSIIHRPSFLPTKPSPLLASAMVAIGSQFDHRSDAKQYSLVLLEVATRLLRRRDNITSRSRLADLQTVFLLEALSKYYSRRVEVEMSSRFRALFASLDQARRTLTTSSLAVFRTLRPDHSKEEGEKARRFWLDHETRRRTLQAFSILDMHQVAFFEQPATIIQHGRTRLSTDTARASMSLPCSEELWETSPIDDWKTLATEQQHREGTGVSQGPQLSGESKLDHFQMQTWLQSDSTALEQLYFDTGSHMLSLVNDGTARQSTAFNKHAMTFAKCTPLKSLLIVSGESWIFGKKLESESEFQAAKQSLRTWVGTGSDSLTALWHASALLRSQITFSSSAPNTNEVQATFAATRMLHEPWCIYLAALICWTHGLYPSLSYSTSGPASRTPSVMSAPASSHSSSSSSSGHPSLMDGGEAAQEAQLYLQVTDVSVPTDLAQVDASSLGRIHGLLEVVRMLKILPLLGGLMNEAERVLFRLVEGRSTLSHF